MSDAASCGGNRRETVGGLDDSRVHPAASSEFCDECGVLTGDPHVIEGRVLCGVCAREERLQNTDYHDCDCRKCGGTEI
jgi:hypothetical protein